MKKLIRTLVSALLMLCILPGAAFADDIWRNTLNDQVTLTDAKNFKSYTIGYTIGCNCSRDWDLELVEQAQEDGSIGYSYMGSVTAGSTLSAQINCANPEDMSIGIVAKAADENGEELVVIEDGNGNDSREMIEVELVVPENAKAVGLIMLAIPRSIDLEYSVGYSIIMEMTVDGKEEAPVSAATPEEVENTDTPSGGDQADEQSDLDWIMDDKSDEVDSLGDALSELGKAAVKIMIGVGVGGVGLIAAIIAIIKSRGAKKAAVAGAKVAKNAVTQSAAAPKAKPAEVAESSGGVEDSYVVTDPATGAQTLYVKDADGNWVSSDGGSVLDTGRLSDWQQQRVSDRAWQDQSNEGLKKPTTFEDLDRQAALEEEKIHRESYIEQVAVKHAVYGEDIDTIYEKVSHDQARAEVSAQEWSEIAEHADTAVKIAENLKTTADYSVSALGAVTGPVGTVVKDVYAAGTTIGGDVAEAVAAGKDAFDVAQAAAGAVTKSAVSVIQNHATGVVGKSAADIVGGAASGGIDAYVKGESVGQGIAKGTASGAVNAMVDTGGEMVGALKDGSSLGADAKDFVSSVSDTAGDFMKNTSSDAINESFDKTFRELNPKKK